MSHAKPYSDPSHGTDVNLDGEWRFHCPNGDTSLSWSGPARVYCIVCNEAYQVSEIVDKKTDHSLKDTLAKHADLPAHD